MLTFVFLLRQYWNTKWPFVSSNFSSIMSQRRFELIMKFLHFSDTKKKQPESHPDLDKLYKIRDFVEALVLIYKY